MNNILIKILIISAFTAASFGFAQSQNLSNCGWNEIEDARKKYDTGVFDDAARILNTCLAEFDTQKKIEALSLLCKIYFETQNDSLANYYATQLLEINPNYQPTYSRDPVKFLNIIREIKDMKAQTTVTGISKKAENVSEAPATVILISKEVLERRAYLDIEALMHDLPGFDISRSNGNLYTHIYQRGYRSINTNRTLLLIDGVEENDLWSSNVYLSRQYALSNIKNIEIVYGPASTMYGSNAFLGVININTQSPNELIDKNNTFGINSRVGYGTYNTRFIDATAAARTKSGNMAVSLTGRVFFSDEQDLSHYPQHDYASYTFENDAEHYRQVLSLTDAGAIQAFSANYPDAGGLYRINTDSTLIQPTDEGIRRAIELDNNIYDKVYFADMTESYYLYAKAEFKNFILGWNYWSKAEGTGSQYTDLIFLTPEQKGAWRPIHNSFYAKYENNLSSQLNISSFTRFKTHSLHQDNNLALLPARYYLGNFNLNHLMQNLQPEIMNIYLFQKSNQLRQEIKAIYQPLKRFDIVSGFEVRYSSVQGDYLSHSVDSAEASGVAGTNIEGGNQFFSRDVGFYTQTGIKITEKLKLTAGLRFDNNKVRINQGYGNSINPRVALVFTPKNCTYKLIYAEAFKDATNREKYSTAEEKRELPNPFLQPEKVKNIEAVLAKSLLDKSLHINTSFYYSRYSNIVQEVKVQLDDGSATNQNQAVGEAEVYGINAFLTYKQSDFSAYANYTFTQPYALNPTDSEGNPQTDSLGNVYEKLRISDIANHQINFGANYLWNNTLNINLRANYSGRRITGYNTTVPTNLTDFSPYIILNGALTYTSPIKGLKVQFTVFNILNTEYFSPGLDYASGDLASKLVQNRRNIHFSLIYQY
jgi:outer membrane receptor protein involved in Fe transport